MPRLENWFVRQVLDSDGYKAPEQCPPCLAGEVYEHPKHEDGKLIKTSVIVDSDRESNTITTKSGNVYTLGKVDPSYMEWLKTIDQTDPFPRFTTGE